MPGGGAGQGTQPGGSCLTTLPALVGGAEGAGVLLGVSWLNTAAGGGWGGLSGLGLGLGGLPRPRLVGVSAAG